MSLPLCKSCTKANGAGCRRKDRTLAWCSPGRQVADNTSRIAFGEVTSRSLVISRSRLAVCFAKPLEALRPRPQQACFFSGPVEDPDRLERVLTRIDEANRQDPHTVEVEGVQFPYELAYSVWVSGWVKHLDPSPSEALVIAARGQHICRWQVPRSTYPEGRVAYLQWREDLKWMHADKVASIMLEEGYSEDVVQVVKQIMLKKTFRDQDTQTLEDALCLTFFEHQLESVQQGLPAHKLQSVLEKTWKKMGIRGRAAATQLSLPAEARASLEALAGSGVV